MTSEIVYRYCLSTSPSFSVNVDNDTDAQMSELLRVNQSGTSLNVYFISCGVSPVYGEVPKSSLVCQTC